MAIQYKPILFSTEMVKANLEGRKTKTRRLHGLNEINKNPNEWTFHNFSTDEKRTFAFFRKQEGNKIKSIFGISPYQIGDILWVREKFEYFGASFSLHDDDLELCGEVIFNYYASKNENLKEIIVKNILAKYAFANINKGWKPSIHMPKEAAIIFLEVTNVRVERLQDISEEDAIAEGTPIVEIDKLTRKPMYKSINNTGRYLSDLAREGFKILWKSINGEDSWKSNPWVWVYEFKVVEKPKDFPNE